MVLITGALELTVPTRQGQFYKNQFSQFSELRCSIYGRDNLDKWDGAVCTVSSDKKKSGYVYTREHFYPDGTVHTRR